MTNINLYKKMHMVMIESESLDKTMTVGTGKNSYSAISEKAVLNVIKPLLKKHGLLLFPVTAEITEHFSEYTDSYGKNKVKSMSQVLATYKIVDIDTGEFEMLATVGNGSDTQDKGSGKAWTYAYKGVLQKTFCLFSGEDTDNTHSDDIGGGKSSGTDGDSELKVTVEMLTKEAEKHNVTISQLLATYKKETGKSTDDLKFISKDKKVEYYNRLKNA